MAGPRGSRTGHSGSNVAPPRRRTGGVCSRFDRRSRISYVMPAFPQRRAERSAATFLRFYPVNCRFCSCSCLERFRPCRCEPSRLRFDWWAPSKGASWTVSWSRTTSSSGARTRKQGLSRRRLDGGSAATCATMATGSHSLPTTALSPGPRSRSSRNWAVASLVVDVDGSPRFVQIIEASSSDFGDAAADAVRLYRFTPGEVEGRPVSSRIVLPVLVP